MDKTLSQPLGCNQTTRLGDIAIVLSLPRVQSFEELDRPDAALLGISPILLPRSRPRW